MSDTMDVGVVESTDGRYDHPEPISEIEFRDFARSPIVRIRRTTVFEDEKRGGDRRLHQFNYPARSRSRPGSRDSNEDQSRREPSMATGKLGN